MFVPQNPFVISYLGLRKAVGIIGFCLPFVLVFGKMLFQGGGLQSSISRYYYTDMRDVFVGSMCSIGIFLMSCRGFDRRDEIAGRFSCAFALGVALCPTTPDGNTSAVVRFIGALHLCFAALLFLTLAFFCICLFTETHPGRKPAGRKKQRNNVYLTCGYAMIGCIVLLGVVNIPFINPLVARFNPVFWLEAVAVIAFGFAWLTKGETILKDETIQERPPDDARGATAR